MGVVEAGRILEAVPDRTVDADVSDPDEPDLGEAVAKLVGGRAGAFPLKKAGVALVELTGKGSGLLRLLLTPAALRAL